MQIYFLLLFKDPKELPIGFVNYENDCSETFYRDNCEANLLGCYFMTVSVHLLLTLFLPESCKFTIFLKQSYHP